MKLEPSNKVLMLFSQAGFQRTCCDQLTKRLGKCQVSMKTKVVLPLAGICGDKGS